ncbi:MAG: Gfo/Idh/MocA family oxidoreductase [Bacteroidales bacterium]|nr:Gfo/Idh/MocA family oxidoreductase [Bacteroidales bacterium]
MKNFAIIGVAGFVARRHVQAIKDTNNNLIACLDPFDSVGFLDQYFPDADYFREFERFDRHIDKIKRQGKSVDYISICSPNYLHDSHIRFALRNNATAICEKPVVLNPWNIEALCKVEEETGNRVYTILQLRLHPEIINLKKFVENNPQKNFNIILTYITSRGKWYHFSWKGDVQKSGGIITNIGIHFFDILLWIFGECSTCKVFLHNNYKASGYLQLKRAEVKWFLSVDYNDIPDEIKKEGKRTYRALIIDGKEFNFSEGFTDLHTVSYYKILNNEGFGLLDAYPSIELTYKLRNSPISNDKDYFHPFLNKNAI